MRKHCPRLAVAASALCLALLPLACAYNGTLVLEPHIRTLVEHEARDTSAPHPSCSPHQNGAKSHDGPASSCSPHQNGAKSHDGPASSCDAHDASSPEKEIAYLRTILKAILISSSNSSAPPTAAPTPATDTGTSSAPYTPLPSSPSPPNCPSFNSCSSCVQSGCAWCLAARACRPDVPWQCQGDIDHVSHSGIGKHAQCPTVQELQDALKEREAAVHAAKTFLLESASTQEFADASAAAAAAAAAAADHDALLVKRAADAASHKGKRHPYEVIGVDPSASASQIRKAYLKLSLKFHPDKNGGRLEAEQAFMDIQDAYEIIGDPEKRSVFDDFGSGGNDPNQQFTNEGDWQRHGNAHQGNFYSGSTLITPLTMKNWARRVQGRNDIWVIEFYAPWCGACQGYVPTYKAVAEALQHDEGVEVGSVNCISEPVICQSWFGIQYYPTILIINDAHSMRQEAHGNKDLSSIVPWIRDVATEWRFLFDHANLTRISTLEKFKSHVMSSDAFHVVVFSDGLHCSPCKTAASNALRLSSALRRTPPPHNAHVSLVNCEEESARELCYEHQKLPPPPHAPETRGYNAGVKPSWSTGEVLYNSNDMEPHVALQLIEKIVRLMQPAVAEASSQVASGADAGYEKNQKPDDKKNQAPPPPMWNGPVRNHAALGGGGGGGGGHFQALPGR